MSIEELERSILAGARQELGPTAKDRMRVQSGLVLTEAWWKPAPLRNSLLRRSLRGAAHSWRGGVALGLVIGALVGYGAGQQLGVAARSSVPALPPSESASATAGGALPAETGPGFQAVPALAAPEPSAAPAAVAASEVVRPPVLPGVSSAASNARVAEAAAARRAAAHDSGSTLAQELSLLQRARRALNRNDARLALGIVESLDERFPNGVLMEERSATRILTLCQLDRTQEAREQGQRFLAAHPRSVYAERVRDSCAGKE